MTILINPVSCDCKLLRRYREHLPTLEKTLLDRQKAKSILSAQGGGEAIERRLPFTSPFQEQTHVFVHNI